jgi:radical SAM/Cys-rich protein
LNSLGYGRAGSGLSLTLVHNPLGPVLPPPEEELEEAYRRELGNRHGIAFNRLFTITNLPISRFLDQLIRTGRYQPYMEKLVSAFNPAAAAGVMCRTMLSVDWQGRLHDCDFNQMLELGLEPGQPRHIRDFDFAQLARRRIVNSEHCYGCTAGAGSSCGGAIVERTGASGENRGEW